MLITSVLPPTESDLFLKVDSRLDEFSLLCYRKIVFLVVDPRVQDRVRFSREIERCSNVVVNDTIAIACGAMSDIGDSTNCRSVPRDFRTDDFHFDFAVRTNAFVSITESLDVFEANTCPAIVNVEPIVASILGGHVADDDEATCYAYTTSSTFAWMNHCHATW